MLRGIPSGAAVFLDSTIIHYAFVSFGDSTSQCIELLRRIANRDVSGFLSVPVLNDALHKVMCSEAQARFAQPRAGLVRWLKDHSEKVRELTQSGTVLTLIGALPIHILQPDLQTLSEAQQLSRRHGLLAGDAAILALMNEHRVVHIATNDDDFDRVPGLTAWKPR